MKVSALKGRKHTVPIVIPGGEDEPDEVVKLIFCPGALTLELWESLTSLAENPASADVEAFKTFLMNEDDPLVVGWDLENDDGSPFPCDPEHMAKLPFDFLGMMVDAIGTESVPNGPRGGISAGGSPQKEPQEPAPGGTQSSEQQTVLAAVPGSS